MEPVPGEKEPVRQSSEPAVDSSRTSEKTLEGDGIIEHRYLEFDTPLPAICAIGRDKTPLTSLPDPPNLDKYQDPFTWPNHRKNTLLWISTVATSLTAYCAGMYASGVEQMSEEWHVSEVAVLVGITLFTVGFGLAPMVLAPFSELTGRRPVFVISGLAWVVFQVFCAVTRLYVGMLLSRLAAGMASSTFSTMVGGVIADMYRTEDRNTPMTIFTAGVLFGTGLGPLVSGFIAQHLSWRWIFWVHLIAIGLIMLLVVFFFYESRGSVLLSRRAAALNKYYAACEAAGSPGILSSTPTQPPFRLRWKCAADEERATLAAMIHTSLTRPMILLTTEPVVFAFSLWISFSWGILYLLFSAIPYVFRTAYDFTLEQTGAVFASVCIAAVIFTVFKIHQHRLFRSSSPWTPEHRLRFACVEAALLPLGMFLLGWTATPSVHWIVPTIFGVAFATTGIFSVYLATFNYLADCYHRQASSAIACQSMCRNLLGGAFPLFTQAMYVRLGIGGASSLLGGIGSVLTLVPWVLTFYGPRIRAKSKVCSEFLE